MTENRNLIAVEEHLQLESFEKLNAEHEARSGFPCLYERKRQDTVLTPVYYLPPEKHRIPLMDENGIAMQILSVGGMAVQNDLDADRAVANAKWSNDVLYELTQKYPNRFRAFALLAMQKPEEAARELERCVRELGFVGVMLHGPTNYSYYDEPQYDCVWAKLEELGVPLYLHIASPETDQIRMYEGYEELLGNTWNWGYYAATQALRMIFGGVFDRHPGATLILGHMGESLPYLLGRLDEGYRARNVAAKGRMANPPSYYLKHNVYVTTSGGYEPETMRCCISALGAERILFANDYPHYPIERSIAQLLACDLTAEEKELIYHKNAERLFRIERKGEKK